MRTHLKNCHISYIFQYKLGIDISLPMTCSITELRRHCQKQYNYMGFYQLTILKKNLSS